MLTDTQCRNAKPKGKPFKLTDGKGLYLEVKPNGVKAWRYRFELLREGRRKESVFAIGNYAQVPAGETEEETQSRRNNGRFTLAEAREERAKARALVKQEDAAGKIHTDFARGFICAETIAYNDYVACNGELGAKESAKMRKEGREYIVKDGDVILFRFNV